MCPEMGTNANQQISGTEYSRSRGSEDDVETPPLKRTQFSLSALGAGYPPPLSMYPPGSKRGLLPSADELTIGRYVVPASPCSRAMGPSTFEVSLENESMWKLFHEVGTEMVLTKLGRRMFPTVKVRVRKLNPTAYYFVLMDIVPFDKNRYKYTNEGWVAISPADFHFPTAVYLHPDSPAPGEMWMKCPVSFHKVKLTNNYSNQNKHMLLNSMHKYMVRIHIVEGSDVVLLPYAYHHTFNLPFSTFIAVTAYQSEAMVNLKIQNNPFARGFRPSQKENRNLSSDEDLSNETSNESSAEHLIKKPSSSPSVCTLQSSSLHTTVSSPTQVTFGNNHLTWSSPLPHLMATNSDLRGYPACSVCSAPSYATQFLPESSLHFPIYPLPQRVHSYSSWPIPSMALHSSPDLSPTTLSRMSLNPLTFPNRYASPADLYHLPPSFSGSYQVQSDIFNRMIHDFSLRQSPWFPTENVPTRERNSVPSVE